MAHFLSLYIKGLTLGFKWIARLEPRKLEVPVGISVKAACSL